MSNSFYKIYREQTFSLIKSMIIHLEWIGHAMNRKLTDYSHQIPDDKTQWRYYKHLAGDYHFQDVEMKIISLDTGEEIVFSKEALVTHKKTKSVFLNDVSQVNNLISKYPEQSILVQGILRPYDYSVTINSPNGTILYHDPNLIEEQEYDLVYEIEEWIRGFHYQRFMEAYFLTHNLYITGFLATMYSHMVKRIITLRKRKIKTAQAHSFHVRQYLASHQQLDGFIDYLTKEQRLYLYKNILYIERHTGFQETFDDLIYNLLTVRNLPAFSYTLRQQDHTVSDGSRLPTPVFSKEALNLDSGLSSRDLELWDIDTIVTKESTLAKDNLEHLEHYIDEAKVLGSFNANSNMPTKLLEVSAVDPEDIESIRLIDVLLAEWAHMAANNIYVNNINIINPVNGEAVRVDTKQAYLIFIYACFKGFFDVEFKDISKVPAIQAANKNWLVEDDYYKVVVKNNWTGWKEEVAFFIDSQVDYSNTIVTSSDFFSACSDILKTRRRRNAFVFQTSRLADKNARKQFYMLNYKDYLCDLNTMSFKTYHELFSSLDIDCDLVTAEGWKDLSLSILTQVTGWSPDNNIGLTDVQSAMVKIFKKLSSYTVQFIEDIVSEERIVGDSRVSNVGYTSTYTDLNVNTLKSKITALECDTKTNSKLNANLYLTTVLDFTTIQDKTIDVDRLITVLGDETKVSFKTHALRQTTSIANIVTRELT